MDDDTFWRDCTPVHSEFIIEFHEVSGKVRHQRMLKLGDRSIRTNQWIRGRPEDERNIDARERGVY